GAAARWLSSGEAAAPRGLSSGEAAYRNPQAAYRNQTARRRRSACGPSVAAVTPRGSGAHMKVRGSPPPDGDPPLRISPQISGYLASKVTTRGVERDDPERGT